MVTCRRTRYNMAPIEQNYFTCTLGQAAERRQKLGDRVLGTIIELIDVQAETRPDSLALGFADFNARDSNHGEPPFQLLIMSPTYLKQ
jgi:hypothetical protein